MYAIIESRENVVLDGYTLGDLLHRLPFDQGQQLKSGETISTYGFLYEGSQRGQLTIYHSSNRGAIFLGGDSDWGEYDNDDHALRLDGQQDTIVWHIDGNKLWSEADTETIE